MSQFQVSDQEAEEFEVELGSAPAERDLAAELAQKELALKEAEDRRKALEEQNRQNSGLDTIAQIVKKQEEEARRREEEAARQSNRTLNYGIREDDPQFEELEKLFLESPKKAFAKMAKMIETNAVLPVGQYLAGQIETVRGEGAKERLLQDDINREAYNRYQGEVEATMKQLGPVSAQTAAMALEIVKGRHLNELSGWIAEKNGAGKGNAGSEAPAKKPGNMNPGSVAGGEAGGEPAKKKVYVAPELMANKPLGMTEVAWVNHLRNKGLVK